MKSNVKKGTICAICSALVFGLTPVLASITFDMGSNALTLTFYRNTMAVPVLLVVLLIRKVNLRVTRRELLTLAAISVVFSAPTTYILYAAYDYIGVGLSTTLHFLYPMFTVLFGWMLFKQRPDKVKVIALILATVGVALATGNSDSFALKGIILAVTSAITYAGYLLAIEQTSVHKMDSMKAMFYMCIFCGISVCIFDLPSGNIVYALEPLVLLYTFILSVANSAFAYVLLIVGVKLIGAGNAAIFSMLEPVSGVIAGVMFLGEGLPALKLISCLLILIAVAMPIIKDRNDNLRDDV